MKLSQKADYALRAMLDLALNAKEKTVKTADIARREAIPEKFLELILVDLRKAGLVKSQRGAVGGHRLGRPAADLSVGDIWRAIDGPLSPSGSHEVRGRSLGVSCFHSVWVDVERSVNRVVDRVNLEDLCRKAEARRAVPDYDI